MPRPFSEKEKSEIRKELLTEGRKLFERYGLKKTGIDDLARAVGIAKGSFYVFFDSKEELLFEIHEEMERQAHREIRAILDKYPDSPRESLGGIFRLMDRYFSENLIGRVLSQPEEYRQYSRALAPEKLEAHLHGDTRFAAEVLKFYQEKGFLLEYNASVLAGIIKSVFMINLHRDEIGKKAFPRVKQFLVEAILEQFFPKRSDT